MHMYKETGIIFYRYFQYDSIKEDIVKVSCTKKRNRNKRWDKCSHFYLARVPTKSPIFADIDDTVITAITMTTISFEKEETAGTIARQAKEEANE